MCVSWLLKCCIKVCYTRYIPLMTIFRKMVIRVAETCRRHTVCIIYFHKLICVCWFWYHTCIHCLVHFRQHYFWHKLNCRVLAYLPKAPKLRIQLVLTDVGLVSDRAMLLVQLVNWYIFFFLLFSPLGACHGDEIGYLFHSSLTPDINLDADDDSLKMLRRMVMMWTNFAKSGYRHYFNRLKLVVCTSFLEI